MRELRRRFLEIRPQVQEIRDKCKVSSISVGVVHEGELLESHSTGESDREQRRQADAETAYMLCSVSKHFVGFAVGILVAEGRLDWDDPVSNYLPGFKTTDNPNVGASATFSNILRHRARLSNPVVSILGPRGKVLLPESDFLKAVKVTPTITDTEWWEYSNIGYGVVALAVQHVSGLRYSQFLKDRILKPLNLHHTFVEEQDVSTATNVAAPYVQLEDGEWARLDYEWTSEKNTPVLAAFGIRSSVKDLLKICAAIMHAEQVETLGNRPKPEILKDVAFNPLKEMCQIRDGPYVTRPHKDPYQTTSQYHLGWMKYGIPSCQASWGSYNEMTQDDEGDTAHKYILGRDSGQKNIKVLKSVGQGIGSAASVHTFPDTQSTVIVLSNGLNLGDAADFAAQLYIQELFDLKPRVDFRSWVKEETRLRVKFQEKIMQDWQENRRVDDLKLPPKDYVGDYQGLGIIISVRLNKARDGLYIELNRKDVSPPLEFYAQDTYSFMPTKRDDWLRQGWLDWGHYIVGILRFTRTAHGKVNGFEWTWDKNKRPSEFTRTVVTSASLVSGLDQAEGRVPPRKKARRDDTTSDDRSKLCNLSMPIIFQCAR